jgi:enoyl-CoA hydratase
MAMGVFITASADYVVAAEGPFKIGANEAEIGLPMPRSMTEVCRSRLSPPHFNRAMVTAQIFTPSEAVAAGFADRVVPAADLAKDAMAVATRMAKFNRRAFIATKHGVREPVLKAVREGLEVDGRQLRSAVPGGA